MEGTTEIYGRCLAFTELALLIEVDCEELWIPKSVTEDGDDWQPGDEGELTIQLWFAEKNGLV